MLATQRVTQLRGCIATAATRAWKCFLLLYSLARLSRSLLPYWLSPCLRARRRAAKRKAYRLLAWRAGLPEAPITIDRPDQSPGDRSATTSLPHPSGPNLPATSPQKSSRTQEGNYKPKSKLGRTALEIDDLTSTTQINIVQHKARDVRRQNRLLPTTMQHTLIGSPWPIKCQKYKKKTITFEKQEVTHVGHSTVSARTRSLGFCHPPSEEMVWCTEGIWAHHSPRLKTGAKDLQVSQVHKEGLYHTPCLGCTATCNVLIALRCFLHSDFFHLSTDLVRFLPQPRTAEFPGGRCASQMLADQQPGSSGRPTWPVARPASRL